MTKRLVLLAATSALAVAALVPARAASPPAAPARLVCADGVTALDVWPAALVSGSLPGTERPAVLVLPGWSTGPRDYTELARYLTGRGYVVAIFSHGNDRDPTALDWSFEAAQALDLLVASDLDPRSPVFHEIDSTRLAVVGHSLGGAAALLDAPDPRLKAVVVCGPNASDQLFLDTAALVTVPLLAIDGSLDETAPPAQCSDIAIARAASPDKASLVVAGGNHRNCPADFDDNFVLEPGRWVLTTQRAFPYVAWTIQFPIAPGITPIPGPQQRALAFPYIGGWLDRYVSGLKDPDGWTDGRKADAQVAAGDLTRDFFSAAARKGTP